MAGTILTYPAYSNNRIVELSKIMTYTAKEMVTEYTQFLIDNPSGYVINTRRNKPIEISDALTETYNQMVANRAGIGHLSNAYKMTGCQPYISSSPEGIEFLKDIKKGNAPSTLIEDVSQTYGSRVTPKHIYRIKMRTCIYPH